MRRTLVAVCAMLLAVAAHAKQDKRLTNLIKSEVHPVMEALEYEPEPDRLKSLTTGEAGAPDPNRATGRDDFEFKRVFLRFQFKAGFDLTVVKVTLVPEVELVFQKD